MKASTLVEYKRQTVSGRASAPALCSPVHMCVLHPVGHSHRVGMSLCKSKAFSTTLECEAYQTQQEQKQEKSKMARGCGSGVVGDQKAGWPAAQHFLQSAQKPFSQCQSQECRAVPHL